jgi:hypothetical protein
VQNGGLPTEVGFCTKPLNFEVDAHMEAPTGVALSGPIFPQHSRGDT